MAFNEALIAARKAHGLTQEQLAAKLYVTRQAVSRWERGEVIPGIDRSNSLPPLRGSPLLICSRCQSTTVRVAE